MIAPTRPLAVPPIVCAFCQSHKIEDLIPTKGRHIHDCPGFFADDEHMPGSFDAYLNGEYICSRRTEQQAQRELDDHCWDLVEREIVPNIFATYGPSVIDAALPAMLARSAIEQYALHHPQTEFIKPRF